jgi:hypothetical protein
VAVITHQVRRLDEDQLRVVVDYVDVVVVQNYYYYYCCNGREREYGVHLLVLALLLLMMSRPAVDGEEDNQCYSLTSYCSFLDSSTGVVASVGSS